MSILKVPMVRIEPQCGDGFLDAIARGRRKKNVQIRRKVVDVSSGVLQAQFSMLAKKRSAHQSSRSIGTKFLRDGFGV